MGKNYYYRGKRLEMTLRFTDPNVSKIIYINLSRVSTRSGYSRSYLSRVFRRERVPSLRCLRALAKVMKMDIITLNDALEKGIIRYDHK